MKSLIGSLVLVVALAGCGGSGGGGAAGGGMGGGPQPPAPPGPSVPQQVELATFARAGMADPEIALPRDVNNVEMLSNENPNEFDDWF